jgi:hypothetical protein
LAFGGLAFGFYRVNLTLPQATSPPGSHPCPPGRTN